MVIVPMLRLLFVLHVFLILCLILLSLSSFTELWHERLIDYSSVLIYLSKHGDDNNDDE